MGYNRPSLSQSCIRLDFQNGWFSIGEQSKNNLTPNIRLVIMVYNQKLITDDIIENTSDLPPRIDTRRIQASRVFICDSSAGTSSLFRAKGGKRNVTVISRYFKATMWKTLHFFWWGSYGYLFFWEFMSEWEKLRINGHENTDNLGARMHSEYAGKMGSQSRSNYAICHPSN